MSATDLARRLDTYCAWHRLTRLFVALQYVVFACAGLLAVCILLDKAIFLGIDYTVLSAAIASTGLAILLGFYLLSNRRAAYVAYLVDRTAGLRNLVASGLSVAVQADEVSGVVAQRAADALKTGSPRKLLPLRLTRAGRYLYVPAALLAAALLLPHMDLFARKQAHDKRVAEKKTVEQGVLKLTARLQAIQPMIKATEKIDAPQITSNFTALAKDLMGADKKDALTKIGEFENKYSKEFSDQREFERMAKTLDLKPDLKDLPKDAQDAMKKLLDGLKGADMKEAADALRDLAKQMQDPKMSEEAKKKLAAEMRKAAEQMQGAGKMDSKLADLMRQIEASQADPADLAKQCQQAGKELSELADMCDQFASLDAMKKGLKEAKEAMLGDSFSGFDAKDVEARMAAEAAEANEGAAGLGFGDGTGDKGGKGNGNGTGGEGIGRGGNPPENKTDTTFEAKKSPGKTAKGAILNQMFVSGIPDKGDAPVEYSEVAKAAKEHAASALAQDKIPREYEEMVKKYFDDIDLEKPAP